MSMTHRNALTHRNSPCRHGRIIHFKMFSFLTFLWSRDSCCWSKSKDGHFPNVGFAWRAFLHSLRLLLTHPVESKRQKNLGEPAWWTSIWPPGASSRRRQTRPPGSVGTQESERWSSSLKESRASDSTRGQGSKFQNRLAPDLKGCATFWIDVLLIKHKCLSKDCSENEIRSESWSKDGDLKYALLALWAN